MEIAVILIFSLILITSVILGIGTSYALLAGSVLFCIYARLKGFRAKEILRLLYSGFGTIYPIMITFSLIGIMGALWRSAGTIPMIIVAASPVISPKTFILATFLLNSLVSTLIGSSFGTASTAGAICVVMGKTLGADPVLVAGALLAGAYVGDRWSPVSTTFNLTSSLTGTKLRSNIPDYVKSAVVPLLITCLLYLFMGWFSTAEGSVSDPRALFEGELILSYFSLIPALLIIILTLFHCTVRVTIFVSTLSAFLISVFLQHYPAADLLRFSLTGFVARDASVGGYLNGGGIKSMLGVITMILIASTYSGFFHETDLMKPLHDYIHVIYEKTTPYAAVLVTSVFTTMAFCSQPPAVLLTEQLCEDLIPDKKRLALYIGNSAAIITPLIPWTAGAIGPLASAGGPRAGIPLAVYLYILPLYCLIMSFQQKQRRHP